MQDNSDLRAIRARLTQAIQTAEIEGALLQLRRAGKAGEAEEYDPDDKAEVWAANGRPCVVVTQGGDSLVQVGGEVVKVLVAPKELTVKQRKAAYLRQLDKDHGPRKLSVKREAEILNEYLAEKARAVRPERKAV